MKPRAGERGFRREDAEMTSLLITALVIGVGVVVSGVVLVVVDLTNELEQLK
jgi:hypothetical protein